MSFVRPSPLPGSWTRRGAVAVATIAMLAVGIPARAATTIGLGTAGPFAVLAGSGLTNTGATTITGDVGTFPTASMTGFDTVVLAGVNHGGDAVSQQAKQDLRTGYDQAFASAPATAVATELGGSTLTPGVYHGATLEITGALTLDTLGDPDAVFVFQSDSTLITASASQVVVLGGATACNVFWQVGSSATLGSDAALVGTILASTSISAGDGASVQGRLLALDGAVTLQHNTITTRGCDRGGEPGSTTTTSTPSGGLTTSQPASNVPPGGDAGGTTASPGSGGANPPGTTGTTGSPPGDSVTLTELPRTGIDGGLVVPGAMLVGLGSVFVRLAAGSRLRRAASFDFWSPRQ